MPQPSKASPEGALLDKLFSPLLNQEAADDLEDHDAHLPTFGETLRFVKKRPLWWKGSDKELLEELNVSAEASQTEVANALREVYASVREGLL